MKKTTLILIAALLLLTIGINSQAQPSSTVAIKITKNQWSETTNNLDVYGLGTNPGAVSLKFLGFDKNQHLVIESNNYTFNPDGTFHVVLSDAKKEIRFVKVVSIPPVVATVTTPPEVAGAPQAAMSPSPQTVVVNRHPVLTRAEIDKINNIERSSPVHVNAPVYFGISFIGFLIIGLGIVAYFIPCIIAATRRHRKATLIFLVNLFFGWSVLGWIFVLVWALRGNVVPKTVAVPPPLPTTPSSASIN
jgi:hypothetical protein